MNEWQVGDRPTPLGSLSSLICLVPNLRLGTDSVVSGSIAIQRLS